MRWPALLVLLPTLAGAAPQVEAQVPAVSSDGTCSLDGSGDVERCEKLYWRSRIAAVAVPAYTFATDGSHVEHGLVWNLSFDLPTTHWASYFALGRGPPATVARAPFQLNLAASFAWFPTNGELVGRAALRSRVFSLTLPNNPALSFAHVSVGLGVFVNRDGPGPRAELKIRFGHLAWGGVAVAVGYQPSLAVNRHVGDLSIGVEAPWMWWW